VSYANPIAPHGLSAWYDPTDWVATGIDAVAGGPKQRARARIAAAGAAATRTQAAGVQQAATDAAAQQTQQAAARVTELEAAAAADAAASKKKLIKTLAIGAVAAAGLGTLLWFVVKD